VTLAEWVPFKEMIATQGETAGETTQENGQK
jgi:hypothetical protein